MSSPERISQLKAKVEGLKRNVEAYKSERGKILNATEYNRDLDTSIQMMMWLSNATKLLDIDMKLLNADREYPSIRGIYPSVRETCSA